MSPEVVLFLVQFLLGQLVDNIDPQAESDDFGRTFYCQIYSGYCWQALNEWMPQLCDVAIHVSCVHKHMLNISVYFCVRKPNSYTIATKTDWLLLLIKSIMRYLSYLTRLLATFGRAPVFHPQDWALEHSKRSRTVISTRWDSKSRTFLKLTSWRRTLPC